jgi:hypothetical protein
VLLLSALSIVGSGDAAGVHAGHTKAPRGLPTPPGPLDSQNTTAAVRQTVPPLQPDLTGHIDWRALGEMELLKTCADPEDPINSHDGVPVRLKALGRCVVPQAQRNSRPLDIAGFNQTFINELIARAMATISPDTPPQGMHSPAFVQRLFNRWFLQLAWPENGAPSHFAAPFSDALLQLSSPAVSHRDLCGVTAQSDTPVLPDIRVLKEALHDRWLRSYALIKPIPDRLVFEGLCQLSEPAMMRADLLAGFKYGDLQWVFLTLGAYAAGNEKTTSSALIALGTTLALDCLDDPDAAGLPLRQRFTTLLLQMAHAHGKIDLLKDRKITQDHVAIALHLFRSAFSAEQKKINPVGWLVGQVQTRGEIVAETMRELGLQPNQTIAIPSSAPAGYGQGLPLDAKGTPCLPPGTSHRLLEFVLSGCRTQLMRSSALTPGEKESIYSPLLAPASVTSRFEIAFDALKPMIRDLMVPSLLDRIRGMDRETQQAWQCGGSGGWTWEVLIPTTWINTKPARTTWQTWTDGTSSVEPIQTKARDGVLIRLVSGQGAQRKVLKFWAASTPKEPLTLQRYTIPDRALLAREMPRFFSPLNDGDALFSVMEELGYDVTYEVSTDANSEGNLLQTISEQILRSQVALIGDMARETTEPEQARARLKEMVLGLLPLHDCISGIQGNGGESATLSCLLAALDLLPLGNAVGKAGKAFLAGMRMNRAGIQSLARSLMRGQMGVVAGRQASNAARLREPIAKLFAATGQTFDPGLATLFGAGRLLIDASLDQLRNLVKISSSVPELISLQTSLKQSARIAAKFEQVGELWRVRSHHVTTSNGRRVVIFNHKEYELFDNGQVSDIPMVRQGETLRLVDPVSDLLYGPEIKVRKKNRAKDVCLNTGRGKRAGENKAAVCQIAVVPGRRSGEIFYMARDLAPIYKQQLSVMTVSRTMQRVNLADVKFRRGHVNSDGVWETTAPVAFSFRNPNTGRTASVFTAASLPAEARIMSRRDPNGNAIEYLEISGRDPDTSTGLATLTQRMPFSTYHDGDGAVICMVTIGDAPPQLFRVGPGVVLRSGDKVPLRPATAVEIKKWEKYQQLAELEFRGEGIDLARIVRLRDAPMSVRVRFRATLASANNMLGDALDVMDHDTELAMRFFARFCAPGELAADLFDSVKAGLTRMRNAFPEFERQRNHVIGLFATHPDEAPTAIKGRTSIGAMEKLLDYSRIEKPLMLLNDRVLQGPKVTAEALVLHELSHALGLTTDRAGVGRNALYAKKQGSRVLLQPLIDTPMPARQRALHAASLEHLTTMLALYKNPETRAWVRPFLDGGAFYYRAAPQRRRRGTADVPGPQVGRVDLSALLVEISNGAPSVSHYQQDGAQHNHRYR